jgi:Ribose/xylose/arabinose/galactoside ABC-type transport systems, permease components
MKKNFSLKKLASSREMSLVVVLFVLCVFVQIRSGGSFLTAQSLGDMFRNYAVSMLLSLGMMGVLLVGGIDISIGSQIALSGVAAGLLMRATIISSTLVAFVVSTVVGLVLGLIIGVIIAYGNVPPIITTMGFLNIYRSVAILIAKSSWISAKDIPENVKNFSLPQYGLFKVSNLVWITLVFYIIFFVYMKWTKSGRKIYAVGSNPDAAEVSGIRIKRIKLMVYAIMGTLSGIAGAMWVSLYGGIQGDAAAKGIEMDVIASCVIGGVSLTGGRGSVVGVFLGSLTMAIIQKSLPLIGVSAFWKSAIKGAIIILAVILNVLAGRAVDRNNLKEREM